YERGFEVGEAGDVSARLVEPWDEASGDRVGHGRKNDRDRPRLPLDGNGRRGRACQDDVGVQTDQLQRERLYPIGVTARPPNVDPRVAAISPTQVRKRLRECRKATLLLGFIFVARQEHADASHAVALLRPRRERPRRRAKERDELAPLDHSITSSARS